MALKKPVISIKKPHSVINNEDWGKFRVLPSDNGRTKVSDSGIPENCFIFVIWKGISGGKYEAAKNTIAAQCRLAEITCIDCKKILFGYLQNL